MRPGVETTRTHVPHDNTLIYELIVVVASYGLLRVFGFPVFLSLVVLIVLWFAIGVFVDVSVEGLEP
jgi:hypothetical protein